MPKVIARPPKPFGENYEVLDDGTAVALQASTSTEWLIAARHARKRLGVTYKQIAEELAALNVPMTVSLLTQALTVGRLTPSSFPGSYELAIARLADKPPTERLVADRTWVTWAKERMAVHGLTTAELARRAAVSLPQLYALLRGEGVKSRMLPQLNAVLESEPTAPPPPPPEQIAMTTELEQILTAFDDLRDKHKQQQEMIANLAMELLHVRRRLARVLRLAGKSSTLAE